MSYSENAALEALKTVRDPKSGRDVISAGLLADIAHKDGVVRAVLRINPDDVKVYAPVRQAAEAVLETLEGVQTAQVILTAHSAAPDVSAAGKRPAKSGGVRPHQARRPEGYQGDAHVKRLIAVSSAKGGVGKSTVAANLAVALARAGKAVGLLDCDIHGPSLPMLMGTSGTRAKTLTREDRTLIQPIEAHGVKTMSIGYLTPDEGPIVWRGPMVQGAMSKMLWDVDWGELDMLLIDMPPGTGDAQLGLAQDLKPPQAERGAVIVSTPQDLALLDARKGVEMFAKVDIPVLGVVENMSQFICPNCQTSHALFGEGGAQREAERLNVPFLGAVPLEMPTREGGDAGQPVAMGEGVAAELFAEMGLKLFAE